MLCTDPCSNTYQFHLYHTYHSCDKQYTLSPLRRTTYHQTCPTQMHGLVRFANVAGKNRNERKHNNITYSIRSRGLQSCNPSFNDCEYLRHRMPAQAPSVSEGFQMEYKQAVRSGQEIGGAKGFTALDVIYPRETQPLSQQSKTSSALSVFDSIEQVEEIKRKESWSHSARRARHFVPHHRPHLPKSRRRQIRNFQIVRSLRSTSLVRILRSRRVRSQKVFKAFEDHLSEA